MPPITGLFSCLAHGSRRFLILLPHMITSSSESLAISFHSQPPLAFSSSLCQLSHCHCICIREFQPSLISFTPLLMVSQNSFSFFILLVDLLKIAFFISFSLCLLLLAFITGCFISRLFAQSWPPVSPFSAILASGY